MDSTSQDGVQVEASAEKQSAHQQDLPQLLQGSSHQGTQKRICLSFPLRPASSTTLLWIWIEESVGVSTCRIQHAV